MTKKETPGGTRNGQTRPENMASTITQITMKKREDIREGHHVHALLPPSLLGMRRASLAL